MRVGIDLGGTKIEAMAVNEEGVELVRHRIDTPRDEYAATVTAICSLVEEIERKFDIPAKVGIGIPGTVSPATGLIKNANSVWLIGQPLQEDLSRQLKRSVRLANDADCFTISEATDGAARGARSVFGVILGTGVGGGFCWDGRLLSGPNAIVGEWGHNPLPWAEDDERPGPDCYCGQKGCIETFLSGPGLKRDFFQTAGRDCEPTEMDRLRSQGDHMAEEVLNRYEHRLARGLAHVVNILDPEVIVLGGGLSNLDRLYEAVPKLWDQWIFSDRIDTRLVRAKHGDSSGVRGAAWLWPLCE